MSKSMSGNKQKIKGKDFHYRPSMFGKIALCVAAPAAAIGLISVIAAFCIPSRSGDLFVVCLTAEGVALIGGIAILIDIVRFNAARKKSGGRSRAVAKEGGGRSGAKEKSLSGLLHFLAGLALGLLLGFLIWKFPHSM